MKARRNFAPSPQFQVDNGLDLNSSEIEDGRQKYEAWHWGNPPQKVVDWNDPDMPKALIECGRLVRLHLRAPRVRSNTAARHPRRDRDTMIEFSRRVSENSHLAYDPDHPNERLYLLVSPIARPTLQQRFWHENPLKPMNLNQLAAIAGGRHARPDYPNIPVKPIGILTAVVYQTAKKGDEPAPSYYIHQVGELSAVRPILGADAKGRLWLAGGNSRSPSQGVTD